MKLIQGIFQENILQTKYQDSNYCSLPLCAACSLTNMNRRGSDCVTMWPCPEKFMALKRGDLKAGEGVLIEQFNSSIAGHLPHTKGHECHE